MSSLPFMPFYQNDFTADTIHFSAEEVGVTVLLMMTMWNKGGTLPNDTKLLCRVGRISPRRWKAMWDTLSCFFDIIEDQITNEALRANYQKAVEKSAVRKNAGRKGGRANALKNNKRTEAIATALPKQGQKSETDNNNSEDKSSSLFGNDDYQLFLNVHPRPRDTPLGKQSWEDALASGLSASEVIAATKRYAKLSVKFDPDKVKFSDNWLRDRTWERYPDHAVNPKPAREDILNHYAEMINGQGFLPKSMISSSLLREMIAEKLVTPVRAKERGLL